MWSTHLYIHDLAFCITATINPHLWVCSKKKCSYNQYRYNECNTMTIIWLFGPSASGKTTIAEQFLVTHMHSFRDRFIWLDGDVVRSGLCKDLGYTIEDRVENNRRVMEICKLLDNQNYNVITSFVTPSDVVRREIKNDINPIMVYVWAPLEVRIARDPKGLYKKAMNMEIKHMAGVDLKFDWPTYWDLKLETHKMTVGECVQCIMKTLKDKNVISYLLEGGTRSTMVTKC